MNSLVLNLIQVILASGILFGYYWIALRNKRFHRYNRFYLLAATGLSMLVPFLNIPLYFSRAETDASFILRNLADIPAPAVDLTGTFTAAPLPLPAESWFTLPHVLLLIYFLIAAFVLGRIILSIFSIRRIARKYPSERIGRIHFVNTEEPGTPFSFFRWLFWDRKIELRSAKGEQIFRHEMFHINERHSSDTVLMEIVNMVFWINPFFYLIRKELRVIHEFLADQFAVKENNQYDYAELLLMQVLGTENRLTQPFFNNQIKRRILMLTNSQQPRHQYLRKIMLLPMAAVLTGLFAFSYHQKMDHPRTNPVVVVIDAGHGGSESGVKSGTIKESDLNLQLAKWVQSLNDDPAIQIILTRKSDVTLSLQDRTQLCKQMRADLFISLHVNSAGSDISKGIEVYTASGVVTDNSRILASTLINSLKEVYGTTPEIKQRKEEIYVLDKNPCTSALIECGFITNPGDLAFISDPLNQQKIAKSILKAIHEFSLKKIAEQRNSTTINYPDTLMWMKDSATEKGKLKALVVVDGKEIGYLNDMKKMNDMVNMNDLESVYVLKGDSAIKKYGDKGKEGVIEIYTKEKKTGVKNPGVITKKLDEPESKLFTKVEEEASFPGGTQKWNLYLDKVLDKQVPIKNGAPEGYYMVVIQFVVDTAGFISDVSPLTQMGYGMEEEAMRVIKKGPKWVPAMQNGKLVKAYRKQKIDFFVPAKNETSSLHRAYEVKPDTYPSFPGGDEKWKNYLQRSLNADVAIYKEATNSLIWVQFDVEKDGSLYNLKTLRQYGMGIESEVIRILIAGPKWIPAMKNGKPVATHWAQSFKIYSTQSNEEKGYALFGYNADFKPTISVRKLSSVEPYMLLQVDKETEILSYSISIGTDDKKEKWFFNTGNQFNEATKKMLSELTPGKIFITGSVKISSGGVIKKLPAKVFTVTD